MEFLKRNQKLLIASGCLLVLFLITGSLAYFSVVKNMDTKLKLTSAKADSISIKKFNFKSNIESKDKATIDPSVAKTPEPTKPVTKEERSFIGSSEKEVVFVQWSQDNEQLKGELQLYFVDPQNSNGEGEIHRFTGVRNDSNISLQFTESFTFNKLTTKVWNGTLNSDLAINYTSKNGAYASIQLLAGNVKDYNQKVLQLAGYISGEKVQNDAVKLINLQNEAVKKAVDKVNASITSAINNTKVLKTSTDSGVLSNYEKNLVKMKKQYEAMKANAETIPFDQMILNRIEIGLTNMQVQNTYRSTLNINLATHVELLNSKISILKGSIEAMKKSFSSLKSLSTEGAEVIQSKYDDAQGKAERQVQLSTTNITQIKSSASEYCQKYQDLFRTAQLLVKQLKTAD